MMKATKGVLLLLLLSFLVFSFVQAEEIKKGEKATVESYVKSNQLNNDNSGGLQVNGVIKWEETFPDTQLSPGWQLVDGDGSGTTWEFYTGINFTSGDSVRPGVGQGFIANNFNNANGTLIADWALTPRLPALEVGDSLYISANSIGLTFPDTVTVWLSVSDSNILNFDQQIGMYVDPGPTGEWHPYKFDITMGGVLAGFQVYVGFKHDHQDGGPTGSGSNWTHLDHVILANGGLGAIGDKEGNVADRFELQQNFPNPFNPSTTIAYTLPKSSDVTLTVYNLAGQVVTTLVDGSQTAGTHSTVWDGRDNSGARVASGVYLYKLQAGNLVQTRKMVLLK